MIRPWLFMLVCGLACIYVAGRCMLPRAGAEGAQARTEAQSGVTAALSLPPGCCRTRCGLHLGRPVCISSFLQLWQLLLAFGGHFKSSKRVCNTGIV